MSTLHHVAVRVADPERSAAFYRDVLGLAELSRLHDDRGLRAVWLQAGAVVVMLERELKDVPGADVHSSHVVALAADDLGAAEAHLAARGVPVAARTDKTLFVLDPDGHRVGVSAYRF